MNVLDHLPSQGPLAEVLQTIAENFCVRAVGGVLCPEGIHIAKDLVIQHGRKAEEFEQRVLQGCRGQQQFAAFFNGPLDVLSHLVAGAVGVAELVCFVNHDQIEWDSSNLGPHGAGKIQ